MMIIIKSCLVSSLVTTNATVLSDFIARHDFDSHEDFTTYGEIFKEVYCIRSKIYCMIGNMIALTCYLISIRYLQSLRVRN
jgi:hypothetical protein